MLWPLLSSIANVNLFLSPTFVPFRVDCPDRDSGCSLPLSRHSTEANDFSCRPRCLPRKRRHVQTPYIALPTHHQSSLLSPNVYASAQDPYSPPVSPKTLVPVSYPATSPSALRPCHVCHRRPTTRQVLDAYADCDLCGERACFICLRQCDSIACSGANPNERVPGDSDIYRHDEHLNEEAQARRKICSSCAVEDITEMGTEIVRCLDCVRGHATAWPAGSMPSGWALDPMDHTG